MKIQTMTKVADLSFDGENKGKIILIEEFQEKEWQYSLDGGDSWKTGTINVHQLTDQEIETIARISEKAGQFLNAPEDLELNKNITAKDILDGWGLDFYVPNSDIEKTDDIEAARYYEGDTSFIENARYYQGKTSFTEKELRKTSKEQKIQFYGADQNTLLNEIDDISEIAQYLNGLALDQWEYADNAPTPGEVECQIVRFMLSRDNKKELKEMDTQILYKSDGNYYIEEIIPGEYSDRGDIITHYQVSEEIAKYILSYIEIASN